LMREWRWNPKGWKRKWEQMKEKGWVDMSNSLTAQELRDNGGRRSGIDRRQFSYSDHIPERRSGQERRSGPDRRTGLERRSHMDLSLRKGKDRRSDIERRVAFALSYH
jgi:hypothetical protein